MTDIQFKADKYTIDFYGRSTLIVDSEGEVFAVLVDKDGCLIEYAKAERIMKLLNENEASKKYIREASDDK